MLRGRERDREREEGRERGREGGANLKNDQITRESFVVCLTVRVCVCASVSVHPHQM